jgi:outer membrane lipoprotein-sorting protein
VNAITPEDIQRVAQQYLHPDKLSIVLVGDASVFAKDLAGVGFDQVERIPIGDLDLASPDLRRRSTPRPAGIEPIGFHRALTSRPVDQRTEADVRAFVARAVAAKGGLALLRSIQTVRASSVTTLTTDGGNAELPTITTIRYPAAFRLETTTPTGKLVQVFNAGRYWYQDDRGVHEAPPSMQTQIRGSVQRDLIPLLLALVDGKVTATRSDTVEGGKTVPALKIALPGAPALTLIFDPATTLLARARYDLEAAAGAAVPVEETYSDYRDVKGLKVAFRMELRREGAPPVNRAVRTFDFNVPVDATLFNRPS